MIISFAGHAVVPYGIQSRLKEVVKEKIRNNIIATEIVTSYLGGYGDFDRICALACKELKEEFSGMEVVYVSPYISLSWQVKI